MSRRTCFLLPSIYYVSKWFIDCIKLRTLRDSPTIGLSETLKEAKLHILLAGSNNISSLVTKLKAAGSSCSTLTLNLLSLPFCLKCLNHKACDNESLVRKHNTAVPVRLEIGLSIIKCQVEQCRKLCRDPYFLSSTRSYLFERHRKEIAEA